MVKKYLKKLRIAIFAGFPICRFSIESCMTKLKNYGYFSLEKLTKMDITNKKSWKELFEFPFNSVGIVSNNHYVIFAMFKSDVNDIFNYVCKDIPKVQDFRLIINLSAPNSLNHYVEKDLAKVKYVSFWSGSCTSFE